MRSFVRRSLLNLWVHCCAYYEKKSQQLYNCQALVVILFMWMKEYFVRFQHTIITSDEAVSTSHYSTAMRNLASSRNTSLSIDVVLIEGCIGAEILVHPV
jgi:hypothetical protein